VISFEYNGKIEVSKMSNRLVQQRFASALDRLIEQVKLDRSILAAILCGSLSYDKVWEKSDIDLVLVTIDDKSFKQEFGGVALYADDLNVHAFTTSRTDFRKTVEGSVHNSFMHSLLAKGRLLYTHDPTIADLCKSLSGIGERDTRLQLLRSATQALPPMYKARKWFVMREDLDYTALWILYAATPLAKIEVMGRRILADREVIPQALKLNPEFFEVVYTNILNGKKTTKNVESALNAMEAYLAERVALFDPVIEHLREAGEARSCTDIEDHFERNYGIGGITTACEYLADCGVIGKASTPVKLTKRSNLEVQELAFVYLGEPPDEF
jgi:predicted nucleotidyltransferase